MNYRLIALLLACFVCGLSASEAKKTPVDAKAVAAFNQAFANQDAGAKKAAVAALAGKAAGDDSDIIPLLMAKIDDRQASELVMNALRARTGLPVPSPGDGSATKPKRPSEWQAWYAKWQETEKTKDALAKASKERQELKDAIDKKPTTEAAEKEPVVKTEAAPAPIPDDLGKPVRISFVAGGSMRAYVQSRRLDSEGKLTALRIVHLDGGGEETIAAELISRIDEE